MWEGGGFGEVSWEGGGWMRSGSGRGWDGWDGRFGILEGLIPQVGIFFFGKGEVQIGLVLSSGV